MLYEEWKSRYKNLKNFNTVLQRCPRFWPLAPPRGMNPGVYSLGISEDPPRYLSSKFDASVRSDCWDISIWKTLTQCDGNGNANANADDRVTTIALLVLRTGELKSIDIFLVSPLNHWRLETPKRVTGKQCRPRSDAAFCGVWSGSPLFATRSTIFLKKYLYHNGLKHVGVTTAPDRHTTRKKYMYGYFLISPWKHVVCVEV